MARVDHSNCTHPRTPAGRSACRRMALAAELGLDTSGALDSEMNRGKIKPERHDHNLGQIDVKKALADQCTIELVGVGRCVFPRAPHHPKKHMTANGSEFTTHEAARAAAKLAADRDKAAARVSSRRGRGIVALAANQTTWTGARAAARTQAERIANCVQAELHKGNPGTKCACGWAN